jgi:hypothetical protein
MKLGSSFSASLETGSRAVPVPRNDNDEIRTESRPKQASAEAALPKRSVPHHTRWRRYATGAVSIPVSQISSPAGRQSCRPWPIPAAAGCAASSPPLVFLRLPQICYNRIAYCAANDTPRVGTSRGATMRCFIPCSAAALRCSSPPASLFATPGNPPDGLPSLCTDCRKPPEAGAGRKNSLPAGNFAPSRRPIPPGPEGDRSLSGARRADRLVPAFAGMAVLYSFFVYRNREILLFVQPRIL